MCVRACVRVRVRVCASGTGTSRPVDRPKSSSSSIDDEIDAEQGQNDAEGAAVRFLWLEKTADVTNTAIEIIVTLLMVYLIVEFNAIPYGCDAGVFTKCLAQYATAGGVEPDMLMSDCSDVRFKCYKSPAWNMIAYYNDTTTSITSVDKARYDQILATPDFKILVGLCSCIKGDYNEPYCDFDMRCVRTVPDLGLHSMAEYDLNSAHRYLPPAHPHS